jgi:hypothetical protein
MQIFQELIPEDSAKSVNYCRWFKNLIRGNIGVLDQVLYTDESWFHFSGYVNSQNYRTWRTENPHNYTETPLHPQKNRRVVCHFEASNNWTFAFSN